MEQFFEHFCSCTAWNFGAYAEYDDLHVAMHEAFERHGASVTRQAEEELIRKIAVLEASVHPACWR